ncbi:MAG: hypothetical protein A2X87_05760 [Deltaproteobacteria bacterium GWC2_42_51]|nr:MAG: hypothetical protein A2067_02030 [Deltaproteobacteria bacterium GWB2_42_7]OGP31557.1 MAG: hypothetical protein A2X87_05760 [Deltaproteobacteria bacterium GWC2_42_51]OGP39176.1 MAG: hypothetical protein A2090_00945 [Deltaproteobacteria bacterium GWD2_42_10]OGP47086.1 MAG: hypothetical protein A2022_10805 [Deltaproteobacteria bacterium GWF2_42_12]OGQ24574.1 MAG: hypothetical protein A3D29_02020 [Deltaproteobacteria bacterium RIFCSPHIGHO2_02_FULL_42_44]OGQ35692.1 MAG: hypothetical protein
MKKANILFIFAAFFPFVVSLWVVPKADAVPAFARQTGQACSTCHFQHFPMLNAFGRAFKAGGYTMVGGQSLVEGDDLSLPNTLNASLVTKIRYQKTNGKDYTGNLINGSSGTNRGQLQFPDEAALFLGGRAGEHIGFVLEASLKDSANVDTTMFTSFKMPIVYDVADTKLSIIPFTTDGLGASFGFELLNTGAVRNIRVLENRTQTSAQQYIGTSGAAQGFAFVAANDMGFINYSLWGPTHASSTDFSPFMSYIRVAATPQVEGWDIGVGGQLWSGAGKANGTTYLKADAWAIDAQLQGDVGMPLGVYVAYANADKKGAGDFTNQFNSSETKDKKAWSIVAELGIIPGKTTVSAGYLAGQDRSATGATDNNYKQNATTLGVNYLLTQNVEIQLNHSFLSGNYYDLAANNEQSDGDNLTTLMLFAGF